jgi:hypothetical protein
VSPFILHHGIKISHSIVKLIRGMVYE